LATHKFVIEGKTYAVEVGERSGDTVEVSVNGKMYTVELAGRAAAAPSPLPAGAAPQPTTPVPAPQPTVQPSGGGVSGEVRAPISGVVLRIAVAPGQSVAAGTLLLVLEAMKMENEIFAPSDGTVAQVCVAPRQDVRQGELLITIDGAA